MLASEKPMIASANPSPFRSPALMTAVLRVDRPTRSRGAQSRTRPRGSRRSIRKRSVTRIVVSPGETARMRLFSTSFERWHHPHWPSDIHCPHPLSGILGVETTSRRRGNGHRRISSHDPCMTSRPVAGSEMRTGLHHSQGLLDASLIHATTALRDDEFVFIQP